MVGMFDGLAELFQFLAVFALIGFLALLGGAGWLIYWLFNHLTFV
jgi:hypothetical protein